MKPDGGAVSLLGGGIAGWSSAWSTDGTQIAFESVSYYAYAADLYVMSANGSEVTLVSQGATSTIPTATATARRSPSSGKALLPKDPERWKGQSASTDEWRLTLRRVCRGHGRGRAIATLHGHLNGLGYGETSP